MAGKILKGGGAPGEGEPRIVKRSVYESGRGAEEILDEARAEAERLIAEAREETASIRENAVAEGRAEGLRAWNERIVAATSARDKALAEAEREILQLAVHIAEKIIGEQLRLDPETTVSIVREALKSARRDKDVTIEVHPDAVAVVEARLDELRRNSPQGALFGVRGDASIAPGGCVVRTEAGTVDAKLESQLACLEELLLREAGR